MAQPITTTPVIVPFPGRPSRESRPEAGDGNIWPPMVRTACFVGAAAAAWVVVIAPAAFLI